MATSVAVAMASAVGVGTAVLVGDGGMGVGVASGDPHATKSNRVKSKKIAKDNGPALPCWRSLLIECKNIENSPLLILVS